MRDQNVSLAGTTTRKHTPSAQRCSKSGILVITVPEVLQVWTGDPRAPRS